MGISVTKAGTSDDLLVRVGDRFVSTEAAQLHVFGVLLGAHLGEVGFVPDADIATLPVEVQLSVHELIEAGIWWHSDGAGGYRIDPDQVVRTMRESLERLNDPALCVGTGSEHVRGEAGVCLSCGATV